MMRRTVLSLLLITLCLTSGAAYASSQHAMEDSGHRQGLYQSLESNYMSALRGMAEQFTNVMMQQLAAIGGLFDARQQMETQRLYQALGAEAHKDYHPDMMMCRIGTNIRGLAEADAKASANAALIDAAMARRQALSSNISAAGGPSRDLVDRMEQFKVTYCDVSDNGETLSPMCGEGGPVERVNKDVDYTKTLDNRYTLDIDFSDATMTADEEDILALSKNIFSFETALKIPDSLLTQETAQDDIQDLRSAQAMSSVIRHSYGALAGMRAAGGPHTGAFMAPVLTELGVPAAQVEGFLGKNPSYFAQMEVLSRKLFQSPAFYTNLYTKPANVDRIGASLLAIRLMQDRDRYESALRREMLVSMMLELQVRAEQDAVNNSMLSTVSELFVPAPTP